MHKHSSVAQNQDHCWWKDLPRRGSCRASWLNLVQITSHSIPTRKSRITRCDATKALAQAFEHLKPFHASNLSLFDIPVSVCIAATSFESAFALVIHVLTQLILICARSNCRMSPASQTCFTISISEL